MKLALPTRHRTRPSAPRRRPCLVIPVIVRKGQGVRRKRIAIRKGTQPIRTPDAPPPKSAGGWLRRFSVTLLVTLLMVLSVGARELAYECNDAYRACRASAGTSAASINCYNAWIQCIRDQGYTFTPEWHGVATHPQGEFVLSQASQTLQIGLYNTQGAPLADAASFTNVQVFSVSLADYTASANHFEAPWALLGTAVSNAPGVWDYTLDTTWVTNAVVLRAALHNVQGQEMDAVAVVQIGQSYSVPIHTGLNLIANQLDHGSNTLDEIFPSVPDGSVLYKYSNANASWSASYYSAAQAGWTPTQLTLEPGEGAFLQSPTNFALRLTGTPHVPVLPVSIPSGVTHLVSRQTNAPGTFETIVGTAPSDGAMVFQWNGTSYHVFTYDSAFGGWVDGSGNTLPDPTAAVGEAMWIAPGGGSPASPPANPFVFYRGLLHQAASAANLVLQSNLLTVSNIGTSGMDGVLIDARLGLNLLWKDVTTTNPWPAGTSFEWQYVNGAGTSKTVVGKLRSQQGAGSIDVLANFSSLGVTNYQLSFYRQSALVGQRSVNANSGGDTLLYSAAPGSGTGTGPGGTDGTGGGSTDQHTHMVECHSYGGDHSSGFFIKPNGTVIQVTGLNPPSGWVGDYVSYAEYDEITYSGSTGGISVSGIGPVDTVGITYTGPINVAASYSHLQLAGTNLSPVTLVDESINPFGVANHVLGQATFAVSSNRLPIVGNIGSSGQDGVSLSLGGVASAQIALASTGTMHPAGATFTGQAFGTLNGVTNQALQTVTFAQTATNMAITADFTALGAAMQNVQILSNGVPVYNSNTNAARMVVYVDGMQVFGSWWLWGLDIDHIDIYWGSHITNLYNFSIPGTGGGSTAIQGNQLVFQAFNSTNTVANGLTSLAVTGAGVPHFTIESETSTRLPVQLQATLTPSSLLLTWAGGGVLQQSSDLSGWADMPGAASPYAAPLNSPMKFFRVRTY